MRVLIRYFFRTLRLVLTPFMLLSEKLSTPKAMTRTAKDQALVDEASKDLALYQFSACPFCIIRWWVMKEEGYRPPFIAFSEPVSL